MRSSRTNTPAHKYVYTVFATTLVLSRDIVVRVTLIQLWRAKYLYIWLYCVVCSNVVRAHNLTFFPRNWIVKDRKNTKKYPTHVISLRFWDVRGSNLVPIQANLTTFFVNFFSPSSLLPRSYIIRPRPLVSTFKFTNHLLIRYSSVLYNQNIFHYFQLLINFFYMWALIIYIPVLFNI